MRGRLINPFLVEIARIDTNATKVANGYDDTFKTVRTKLVDGEYTSGRVDSTAIKLRCQIDVGQYDVQKQMPAGNDSDGRIVCLFHFRDLEAADMIDTNGAAKIRVNDRLVAVYDDRTEELIQRMPGDGLYATEVQPIFGLGRRRNLLAVTFNTRESSVAT